MKTFATLHGSNRTESQHEEILERLISAAQARGYQAGNVDRRLSPSEIQVHEWEPDKLTLRESESGSEDFFLAVIAPKVPSVAPIPIQMRVSAPLFSAIIMPNYIGVWAETRRPDKFTEVHSDDDVEMEFSRFLDSITKDS
ncbi:MAG: hypothetical protein H7A51_00350 [Akkermansiaceae bacterium]|nr:hypothetical protein [Akkermansiaceae bacterium]